MQVYRLDVVLLSRHSMTQIQGVFNINKITYNKLLCHGFRKCYGVLPNSHGTGIYVSIADRSRQLEDRS